MLFVYSKSICFLDNENFGSIFFRNIPAPKLGKKLVIENMSAKATNLKPDNRLNIIAIYLIRFPKIINEICSKCIRFKPLRTFLYTRKGNVTKVDIIVIASGILIDSDIIENTLSINKYNNITITKTIEVILRSKKNPEDATLL